MPNTRKPAKRIFSITIRTAAAFACAAALLACLALSSCSLASGNGTPDLKTAVEESEEYSSLLYSILENTEGEASVSEDTITVTSTASGVSSAATPDVLDLYADSYVSVFSQEEYDEPIEELVGGLSEELGHEISFELVFLNEEGEDFVELLWVSCSEKNPWSRSYAQSATDEEEEEEGNSE